MSERVMMYTSYPLTFDELSAAVLAAGGEAVVPVDEKYDLLGRVEDGKRAVWIYGSRNPKDPSHFWEEKLTYIGKELLEENGNPEVLPEDALVFCMHQGYHFYFMHVSEGDNPRIYHYSEVDEPPRFTVSYHNLAEFLRSGIEKRLKYLATYGKNAL